jgi:hypothetical protein
MRLENIGDAPFTPTFPETAPGRKTKILVAMQRN